MVSKYRELSSRDLLHLRVRRRGQVSIFVIIALLIVVGVIGFFVIRAGLNTSGGQTEFDPVFELYEECIDREIKRGIGIAGVQGGRIFVENFESGSEYAPFSSELNFVGQVVPYWYYLSGNGLIKEQVPSKKDIEEDIGRYVEEEIGKCDFSSFYEKGWFIDFGEPQADVRIFDSEVRINLKNEISVSNSENSARKGDYELSVDSKLGKFYGISRNLYDSEKESAFLEGYAEDVLRLYAPVDSTEISCSSKIWKTREVVEELKDGLSSNIAAISFDGDGEKYFVVETGVDFKGENVRAMYSVDWPSVVDIAGADEELMVASPVGTQSGLGAMGFCYVPYHFVYDVRFPVIFQIGDGLEVFQFPVVAILDGNLPRESISGEYNFEEDGFDLCKYKTQNLEVNVVDVDLEGVDGASVNYKCLSQRCLLGESENGKFEGKAPSCFGGVLEVQAEGYSLDRQDFSSNSQSSADVILDREFEVNLSIEVEGKELEGTAVVTFVAEVGGRGGSVSLPEVSDIKLSEGLYNATVYVYKNTGITIPASTREQCTEVSKGGFLGFFGGTKEECFDITIPETKVEHALIGGGQGEIFLFASDLEDGKLTLEVGELPEPKSLEELQNNYVAFEIMGVDVGDD
jgi:hypothetical protein